MTTIYAFISLVSSHKWSWYISETHTFFPLKSHSFLIFIKISFTSQIIIAYFLVNCIPWTDVIPVEKGKSQPVAQVFHVLNMNGFI